MNIYQVCDNCKYFFEHRKKASDNIENDIKDDQKNLKDGDCIVGSNPETKYYNDTCDKWEKKN